MKAARQQQFVNAVTEALSKMLGADVQVQIIPLDMPSPAKQSDVQGLTEANRALHQQAQAKQAEQTEATIGTASEARDRVLVGYMVFNDGQPVIESLHEHRECLEESVKRALDTHRALMQVAVLLGRKVEKTPSLDIRAVYAE